MLTMATAELLSAPVRAQSITPAAPSNLMAQDHRWDNGTRIDLSWALASNDTALQGYVIRRRAVADAAFTRVDMAPPGTSHFTVADLSPTQSYFFEVTAI